MPSDEWITNAKYNYLVSRQENLYVFDKQIVLPKILPK